MSKFGYLTTEEVAQRVVTLQVACTRCDRRGSYKTKALVKKFGPNYPMPQWLREISADCSRRVDPSPSIYEICGVHCPGLAAAFGVHITQPKEV